MALPKPTVPPWGTAGHLVPQFSLRPGGWAPRHGLPDNPVSISLLAVRGHSLPEDVMGSQLGLSGASWLVPRGGLGVVWHCPPLSAAPSPWDLPQPCQQGWVEPGRVGTSPHHPSVLPPVHPPTCLSIYPPHHPPVCPSTFPPVCLSLRPSTYPGGGPRSWAQGHACPLPLRSPRWWPLGAVGCRCLSQGSGTTSHG